MQVPVAFFAAALLFACSSPSSQTSAATQPATTAPVQVPGTFPETFEAGMKGGYAAAPEALTRRLSAARPKTTSGASTRRACALAGA
jgi:DNA-binding transcriptional MocR family regulator